MKSKLIKVLITSSGGAAGINCIRALQSQNILSLKIYSTDVNPLSAGLFLSDKSFVVKAFDHNFYIDEILDICKDEKINIVLPTYSKEIIVFSKSPS